MENTLMGNEGTADVCLILEGTYPYVPGGVSTWTHDLIRAQESLSFHVLALLPPDAGQPAARYELPPNVTGITQVKLQDLPQGSRGLRGAEVLFQQIEQVLTAVVTRGDLDALGQLIAAFEPYGGRLGAQLLLDSKPAWDLMLRMYERSLSMSSFPDYFWSWRCLLGGLYSVVLGPLPRARVYHTISTGYAGLYAARAHLETGRPALLTEHGIYTNERRIEIAMADWLFEAPTAGLTVDRTAKDLKDFWIETFTNYSRLCYQTCSKIITLFAGNQRLQLADGAPRDRLMVVPNGIHFEKFAAVAREQRSPRNTIALIGRVVPIKDVKSYIRMCEHLRRRVPDLKALVIGPTEEDKEYAAECQALVERLDLSDVVSFTGRVRLEDYLGRIDVTVLTSISEAQPLTILEAGAAGIPAVATDVGACREMIEGRADEHPALGPGGAVTRLSDPRATADAVLHLLTDPEWYERCSSALRERVRRYYSHAEVVEAYRSLYQRYRVMPATSTPILQAA
jgi:glycosyltransferase involved in cell wall biosynthesis